MSAHRRMVLATATGLIVAIAACAGAPATSSPSPTATSSSTATPVASSTATTAGTAGTTDAPSLRPSTDIDPVQPPPASLAAEGGDPVVGALGSYTWAGGGSDAPWLTGSAISIGAGEPLRVTLAGTTAIGSWSAIRTTAESTGGGGAVALGEGEGNVAFAAPAAGDWTIAVTIRFAQGGSATWYWHASVS